MKLLKKKFHLSFGGNLLQNIQLTIVMILQKKWTKKISEQTVIAADPNAISPIGTWEYMAPECWKRKFGEPCAASDVFAFGLMLWEMLARLRIQTGFPGIEDNFIVDTKSGGQVVDVSLVASRLASGQRPEVSSQCPALLLRLMQVCYHSAYMAHQE